MQGVKAHYPNIIFQLDYKTLGLLNQKNLNP